MTKKNAEGESEADFEKDVVKWADDNGGDAYKLVQAGGQGWPDRTIYMPDGVSFIAELKTAHGAVKPAQIRRIARLRQLGHVAGLCRSMADVIALYNEALARRYNR